MLIFLIIILILAGLLLFYIKFTLKLTIAPVDLPKDLEAYLLERESLVPNIKENCHKRIFWAGRKNKKTDVCIIYIHSFTGSPMELHPLIEQLGKNLKANIFYQRLDGHGRSDESLKNVNLNNWINNIWEAWEIANRIGNKIILISTSTGSALASWLCSRVKNIHCCIMISPNFMPKNPMIRLLSIPGMMKLFETIKGPYAHHKIGNKNIKQYFTTTYPRRALLTMHRACLLANHIPHKHIRIPLIILYSKHDKLVSIPKLKKIYKSWGSEFKTIHNVKTNNHHFLAGEIFSPKDTDKIKFLIEEFIDRLSLFR